MEIRINRRQFLVALAATTLSLPNAGFGSVAGREVARYVSARMSSEGRYSVSGFDETGSQLFDTPLPDRGHAFAAHPVRSHVTAVARRPGTYLIVIDSKTGAVVHQQESGVSRHFYGHAIYSRDGRWLYTTENDVETGNGLIAVRDVDNDYRLIREYSSYGIGPHELNLLSDGKTLVVANGGILTRPELGRDKLNLNTMVPSLTYINAETGALLEEHRLPEKLHKNSIRHFAINGANQICFAMQYEGADDDFPPLVGLHKRGEQIHLMQAPADVQKKMRNYCGSVCVDVSGRWFAVSCPKGNLVTFWSAKNKQYLGNIEITDGCGIAAGAEGGEFLLSSGIGGIYRYRIGHNTLDKLIEISNMKTHWDNHITRLKFDWLPHV